MNIKNRITKLEDKTKKKSGFCECPETSKFEIQYEGYKSDTLQKVVIPDFCDRCRRAIEKQTIIVEFVESASPRPNLSI